VKLDLDAGIVALETRQETGEAQGADRRHHADIERRLLEQPEVVGDASRGLGLALDLLDIGPGEFAQLSERGSAPSAVEECAAKLFLQLLDRRGECRLRDMALLGRASEVLRLTHGKEVADLVHFHTPGAPVAP
jgi:hypothetical protein